jgi:hypothetical protein
MTWVKGPPLHLLRGRRYVLMTDTAGCTEALMVYGPAATEHVITLMQTAIAWATWTCGGLYCGAAGGDDTVSVFGTRHDLKRAFRRARYWLAKRKIYIKGAAAKGDAHVGVGLRLRINLALVAAANAAERKGRNELKRGELRFVAAPRIHAPRRRAAA